MPWKQALDPGSGQTYYFNEETGESSWVAPRPTESNALPPPPPPPPPLPLDSIPTASAEPETQTPSKEAPEGESDGTRPAGSVANAAAHFARLAAKPAPAQSPASGGPRPKSVVIPAALAKGDMLMSPKSSPIGSGARTIASGLPPPPDDIIAAAAKMRLSQTVEPVTHQAVGSGALPSVDEAEKLLQSLISAQAAPWCPARDVRSGLAYFYNALTGEIRSDDPAQTKQPPKDVTYVDARVVIESAPVEGAAATSEPAKSSSSSALRASVNLPNARPIALKVYTGPLTFKTLKFDEGMTITQMSDLLCLRLEANPEHFRVYVTDKSKLETLESLLKKVADEETKKDNIEDILNQFAGLYSNTHSQREGEDANLLQCCRTIYSTLEEISSLLEHPFPDDEVGIINQNWVVKGTAELQARPKKTTRKAAATEEMDEKIFYLMDIRPLLKYNALECWKDEPHLQYIFLEEGKASESDASSNLVATKFGAAFQLPGVSQIAPILAPSTTPAPSSAPLAKAVITQPVRVYTTDESFYTFDVDASYSVSNMLWKVFEVFSSGGNPTHSGKSISDLMKTMSIYEIPYRDITTITKLEKTIANHEREINKLEGLIRYHHATHATNPQQKATIASQISQYRVKIFTALEDLKIVMHRVYNRENVLTVKGRWEQEPRKAVPLKTIAESERTAPAPRGDATPPHANAFVFLCYETTLLQKYKMCERDKTGASNPSSTTPAVLAASASASASALPIAPVGAESSKAEAAVPVVSAVKPSQLRASMGFQLPVPIPPVSLTKPPSVGSAGSLLLPPPPHVQTLVDEASGRTYYYNTLTGKTSWDLPAE